MHTTSEVYKYFSYYISVAIMLHALKHAVYTVNHLYQ